MAKLKGLTASKGVQRSRVNSGGDGRTKTDDVMLLKRAQGGSGLVSNTLQTEGVAGARTGTRGDGEGVVSRSFRGGTEGRVDER